MKIASGTTDQVIYFVCVDSTDYVSRETGKTSGDFTVYRSRNGGAATAMTTPTIAEISASNAPGVYSLLLDEDTTIAAGNETEEMVFHITASGVAPITRTIELYRPKITEGYTLGVNSSGHVSRVVLNDTTTTNTDMVDVSSLATAANLATVDTVVDGIKAVTDNLPNSGALTDLATAANLATVDTVVDGIKAVTDNLPDSGALSSLATAAALTTVDTVVDGIKAVTDNLPNSGTLSSLATASALATTDAVCDAIKAVTDTLSITAIVNGVWDESQASHTTAGTFGKYLDAQVSAVSAPTAAAVADAVWDESLSAHSVAGSTGKALKQMKEGIISIDGSVDDTSATSTTFISNLTASTDGYYHDKVLVFISGGLSGQARPIETYTGSTKSITVSLAFTAAPADGDEFLILATHEHSLGEIADAVWDEAIAGHAVSGSTGATLSSAGSAGDPWITEIPGSYTAGQAGYVLGTTVINKLTNDAIVYVNPSTQYDLELIRSDAYDGTSHDKLSFPAGKSIAGVTCVLTVRNADTDASLMSVSGVGVGSNAEITLTSAQTASLVPGIQKFDVEVQHSGTSKQTVARGQCIVLEDQTR